MTLCVSPQCIFLQCYHYLVFARGARPRKGAAVSLSHALVSHRAKVCSLGCQTLGYSRTVSVDMSCSYVRPQSPSGLRVTSPSQSARARCLACACVSESAPASKAQLFKLEYSLGRMSAQGTVSVELRHSPGQARSQSRASYGAVSVGAGPMPRLCSRSRMRCNRAASRLFNKPAPSPSPCSTRTGWGIWVRLSSSEAQDSISWPRGNEFPFWYWNGRSGRKEEECGLSFVQQAGAVAFPLRYKNKVGGLGLVQQQ
jgi:hypothetical protein